jgi:hypothetical protein
VDNPVGFKESIAQYSYRDLILILIGNKQVHPQLFQLRRLGEANQYSWYFGIEVIILLQVGGHRSCGEFAHGTQNHQDFRIYRRWTMAPNRGRVLWMQKRRGIQWPHFCRRIPCFRAVEVSPDLLGSPKDIRATLFQHPQRAGKLTIKIMQTLPVNITNQDHLDYDEAVAKAHQLMLFLWAVENLPAMKVSIQAAPTSEFFDNRAQEIIGRLKLERSQSWVASVRHPTPQEEKGGRMRGCEWGRREYRANKGRRMSKKNTIKINGPPKPWQQLRFRKKFQFLFNPRDLQLSLAVSIDTPVQIGTWVEHIPIQIEVCAHKQDQVLRKERTQWRGIGGCQP